MAKIQTDFSDKKITEIISKYFITDRAKQETCCLNSKPGNNITLLAHREHD